MKRADVATRQRVSRDLSVVFRVDSSSMIGSGHLVRCLAIGAELGSCGATVMYVCRDHRGAAMDIARAAGFSVAQLHSFGQSTGYADQGGLNGVSETQDVDETISRLPPVVDWVLVDHYSCGHVWERAMRPHCRHLAVIDDLGRNHSCDLLIDPNWHGRRTQERYAGRLDATTRTLLGPAYALLNADFSKHRITPNDRRKPVQRVLVYFGGSDQYGLSALALSVLATSEFAGLKVDVVLGATNTNWESVRAEAAKRTEVAVYEHLQSLAPLLAQADLAIGAVGGTTWERMCLGVPTLAAIIADNQTETASDIAEEGLIELLGPAAKVTAETLANGLRKLLNSPERRQHMADNGQELVDGRGVSRVVDELLALSGQ